MKIRQLNIFCEGPTEQEFCAQVLQPHLFPAGNGIIHTLPVGEKDHHHIFGLGRRTKYQRVRKFICSTIRHRESDNVFFTTMFDLYALPQSFPASEEIVLNPSDPTPYVLALESAFAQDIDYHRFVPFVQLHEFETMLFSDPGAFRYSFEDCEAEIKQLETIAASEPSIENIDNGQHSAPSKRIIRVFPAYQGRKSTAGPDIAAAIGLAAIRKKCPHVNFWLTQLENLPWFE